VEIIIDRRYGKNWFECLFIHIVAGIGGYFAVFFFIMFAPLILLVNRVFFGNWFWDAEDLRSANDINNDLG